MAAELFTSPDANSQVIFPSTMPYLLIACVVRKYIETGYQRISA